MVARGNTSKTKTDRPNSAKATKATKATKPTAKAATATATATEATKSAARTAPAAEAKSAATLVQRALDDGAHDDDRPFEASDVLALHAETLAATVRGRLEGLARAKVTARDATLLEALADELRRREGALRAFLSSGTDTRLAEARVKAQIGRKDLFSALRTFAKDDDTQRALDDIGSATDDADLVMDLERLRALARQHEATLADTDVDAARVEEIADEAARFRSLRAGAGSDVTDGASAAGDPAVSRENDAARTENGRVLFRARNRAFWALVSLDRTVRERGRHAYRHDPTVQGEFASLSTMRAKTRGSKESTPPAPTPAPEKDPKGGERDAAAKK